MATIDVDRTRATSFGLAEEARRLDTPWHAHRKHQLLYAASGSMRLHVEECTWLLPPGRAAWIPGRTAHRVVSGRLALRTVYLSPRILADLPRATAVFAAHGLAREMLLYAMRWGPETRTDALARSYFETLARLGRQWAQAPLPLRLPRAQTPQLQRAMDWTLTHLQSRPTAARAARAAGMSARTMARRFAEETGTTWRRFAHDARILEATARLGQPGASVGEVAADLGFDSLSAFSRAFKAALGQPPSAMLASGDSRYSVSSTLA